jgi:hypothetical protein
LRPDLAADWPAERVRPAGNHPPGHRFETGTLSHEALAGFVAAVGYLESLGGDDADRLGSAYQAIAAHELELAETFLTGLHALPGWRLLGIQDADPGRRVPTFGGTAGSNPSATVPEQRARQRLPLMFCNRPSPVRARPLPSCGSSVARPAVAIKSTRPGSPATEPSLSPPPDQPGMLMQPWNPALIKRRSPLHEPLTPSMRKNGSPG